MVGSKEQVPRHLAGGTMMLRRDARPAMLHRDARRVLREGEPPAELGLPHQVGCLVVSQSISQAGAHGGGCADSIQRQLGEDAAEKVLIELVDEEGDFITLQHATTCA